MKPSATLWVIGSYHNIFRVGAIMQDLGFWVLNDVVWRKTNPMPNFRGRRFTNAHETMIWAARDEGQGLHLQLRSAEGRQRGRAGALRLADPAVHRRGAPQGRDGKKLHPTQKPEGLLARVLLSSSRPGDLVIDPFNGTGTTGAVAKRLGRRYIGFERDQTYAAAAEARIAAVEPLPEATLAPFMTARDAPRVAFSELIERGMIRPAPSWSTPRSATAPWCAPTAPSCSATRSARSTASARWRRARRLQRLDLLARRDQEGPDRRADPTSCAPKSACAPIGTRDAASNAFGRCASRPS
jgi:hypothetical protein